MKKKLLITIPVLGVMILGITLCTPKKDAVISYQTTQVTKGNIINNISATGTIEPIINVEVGTQVSGIISKIYVDFNTHVKKGDVLAELDRTTLEADLKSSEATLNSSKTEYDYQLKNYSRVKGLYDKKLISESEYETSRYTMEKAKSSYEKAQSDIKRVRQNLRYATIYSPIDGVVLNRAVDEGQTVAASFNTPTLFTIANDLKNMQVIAKIDEADIGVVKEGQMATFTVDAYPGELFKGNVSQVRLEPTTTSNVVTYEVVISAPNPELKLKPGLTATISITTEESLNVYIVPTKALKFKPQADSTPFNPGEKSVWIMGADGKINKTKVKVGSTDGINVEIIEGVKEGDLVVTGLNAAGEEANTSAPAQMNPFMPGRPGGSQRNSK